jgi:hypothetical protein
MQQACNIRREQEGTNMAEAKKAQKPQDAKLAEGKGGQAKEKESSEVGGRASVLYTCWRCGAGNWVNSNWSYFICWNDGALNYMT